MNNTNKFLNIICPICGHKLKPVSNMLKCKNNHSYDISDEGYVNLLPPHKNGNIPGDSKEMVRARRNFLNKDYYLPLANELISIIKDISPDILIDIGCGEGYYTNKIEQNTNTEIYGIDISKFALALAAKTNKNINYCTASLHSLVFNDNIADALLCCFCAYDEKEFARILKPKGNFILVTPGSKHLFGLKSILYDEPYENPDDNNDIAGFSLDYEKRLTYDIRIESAEDIWNLFSMTPYYWKTPKSGTEKLKGVSYLYTPVEFIIHVFKKSNKVNEI